MISAALPAPPGPRDALCVKAHTCIEPVGVPVRSGESDAGIKLTKKKKKKVSVSSKKPAGLF